MVHGAARARRLARAGAARDRAPARVRRLAAVSEASLAVTDGTRPQDRAARGRRRVRALAARLAADGRAAAAARTFGCALGAARVALLPRWIRRPLLIAAVCAALARARSTSAVAHVAVGQRADCACSRASWASGRCRARDRCATGSSTSSTRRRSRCCSALARRRRAAAGRPRAGFVARGDDGRRERAEPDPQAAAGVQRDYPPGTTWAPRRGRAGTRRSDGFALALVIVARRAAPAGRGGRRLLTVARSTRCSCSARTTRATWSAACWWRRLAALARCRCARSRARACARRRWRASVAAGVARARRRSAGGGCDYASPTRRSSPARWRSPRPRSRSAVASWLPQRLGRPAATFAAAREDEQQVREPVEVAHALGVDLLAAGDRAPLGAPADGAADVQLGGGERAAGQDEGLQRAAARRWPRRTRCSSHAVCSGITRRRSRSPPSGTEMSAPTSNRSFWIRLQPARVASGSPPASATPSCALSSSTVP